MSSPNYKDASPRKVLQRRVKKQPQCSQHAETAQLPDIETGTCSLHEDGHEISTHNSKTHGGVQQLEDNNDNSQSESSGTDAASASCGQNKKRCLPNEPKESAHKRARLSSSQPNETSLAVDGVIESGGSSNGADRESDTCDGEILAEQQPEDVRHDEDMGRGARGSGRGRGRGRGRARGRGRGRRQDPDIIQMGSDHEIQESDVATRRRSRGRGRGRRGRTCRVRGGSRQSEHQESDVAPQRRSRGRGRGRRGRTCRVRGGSRQSERQESDVAPQRRSRGRGRGRRGRTCRVRGGSRQSGRQKRNRETEEEAMSDDDDDLSKIDDSFEASCLDPADRKSHAIQIALWEQQLQEHRYAKCPLCYCRRRHVISIFKHFQKCSANRPNSYPCRHCQKEFQSAAGLKYHLMAVHQDMNMEASSSENASDATELSHANISLILRKVGKITCQNEGCSKSFTTVTGYQFHRKICGKEAEEIKCTECDKIYYSKNGLTHHMRTIHRPPPSDEIITPEGVGRSKRRAAERALTSMQELTQDLEQSTAVGPRSKTNKDKDKDWQQTKQKKKDRKVQEDREDEDSSKSSDEEDSNDDNTVSDGDSDSDADRRQGNCMYSDVAADIPDLMRIAHTERMHRFDACKKHASAAEVFKVDWSSWTSLSQSESCQYLPERKRSFRFTSDAKKEPSSLELFQTSSSSPKGTSNRCLNLFVGGPVWSIAWCPHRDDVSTETEYAAISCHRSHNVYHYTTKTYHGRGAVQLWSFDGLHQVNQSQASCQLVCCMAHDYGCIWDLKWCPSGCWQTDSSNVTESASTSRLGLLALACSDGSVRILNVPHAECVQQLKEPGLNPTVLRLQSSVTLRPQHQDLLEECASSCGQCWCVDWAPDNGHTKIAAGFSNGAVALWDLLSQSPLLHVSGSCGVYTLPYCLYDAHHARVTGLSWCPYDADYIATVSSDRFMMLWDVRTPDVALTKVIHAPHTGCKWMNYCNVVAVTYDFKGDQSHRIICHCIRGRGPEIQSWSTSTQQTTDWHIDYSDWLHSLLACSDSGDVTIHILTKFAQFETLRKVDRRKLMKHVYSTQIHQLQPCKKTANPRQKGGTSSTLDIQTDHGHGRHEYSPTTDDQHVADSTNVQKHNHAIDTHEDLAFRKQEQREVAHAAAVDSKSLEPEMERVINHDGNEKVACVESGKQEAHETGAESLQDTQSVGTVPNDKCSELDLKLSPLVSTCEEVEQLIQGDGQLVPYSTNWDKNVPTQENRLSTGNVSHTMRSEGSRLSSGATQSRHSQVDVATDNKDNMLQSEQQEGLINAAGHKNQDSYQELESIKNEASKLIRNRETEMIPQENIAVCNKRHSRDAESEFTLRKSTTDEELEDKVYISFTDSVLDEPRKSKWKRRYRPASPASFHKGPLSVAIHKVCFNPNLGTHTWILSGGQTGIVRAHNIKALQSERTIKALRNQTATRSIPTDQ